LKAGGDGSATARSRASDSEGTSVADRRRTGGQKPCLVAIAGGCGIPIRDRSYLQENSPEEKRGA
jgi:hypothetical protein